MLFHRSGQKTGGEHRAAIVHGQTRLGLSGRRPSSAKALDAEMIIEVAIGPADEDLLYEVEVVRSPAGEASRFVRFDPRALLARQAELQTPLLARAEQPFRQVGETLFDALLGTGE